MSVWLTPLQNMSTFQSNKNFNSAVMVKIYKIKPTANCKTRNVIYVIEHKVQPPVCGWNWECSPHTNEWPSFGFSPSASGKPVTRHFNQPGNYLHDLSIFVIIKIHRGDTDFLRHKESYWIWMLHSLAPNAMNIWSIIGSNRWLRS